MSSLPFFYEDERDSEEICELALRLRTVLKTGDRDTGFADYEGALHTFLPVLVKKFCHKIAMLKNSDNELKEMSPMKIGPIEYQSAQFFTLFDNKDFIPGSRDGTGKSALEWYNGESDFPNEVFFNTYKTNSTLKRYHVEYFVEDNLSLTNGLGFIIRNIKKKFGVCLRAVVRKGDFYAAVYDNYPGLRKKIGKYLNKWHIVSQCMSPTPGIPVPGIDGAELLYLDT